MKVLTVLGTRPEIIRLSLIIPRIDAACQHIVVHTGQNHDERLNDIFFAELGLRRPDYCLGIRGSIGEQLSSLMVEIEKIIIAERPDRLLVLGDTNSGLAAIVAKRYGVAVYHMEAGNRCFDDRVPEEVNRRIIDHCSDVLLPYTARSRDHLIAEGIPGRRVFVTGNPIREVIEHHRARIEASTVTRTLGVEPGGYGLVTLHRAENVDDEARLRELVRALDRVQRQIGVPLIVSTHPRTKARLEQFGVPVESREIRMLAPFGFVDFVALERQARLVLTDSGTVQEECAILQVPVVTLRTVTERPETLETGGNILAGCDADSIARCAAIAVARTGPWKVPEGYLDLRVSDIVTRLLIGIRQDAAGQ